MGLVLYLPARPPAAEGVFPSASFRSEALSSRSTLKHPAFYF